MNNSIYVASAYAGDVKENSERAKRYCVHVINEGGAQSWAQMITMCQQSCIKKWRDGGSWTSSKE